MARKKPAVKPGDKFHMLTVVELAQDGSNPQLRRWLCMCDCGNQKAIIEKYLKAKGDKAIKSCGCLRQQQKIRFGEQNKTHGESRSRLYKIWAGMRKRCFNPKCRAYKHYGGRGIKICTEWNEYENFATWAKTHGYQDNLTIERVDVNGDYCPKNCVWALPCQQALNKRSSRHVTAFGETKTMAEWLKDSRCPIDSMTTLFCRLEWGWEPEAAISTPATQQNRANIFKITAFGETHSIKDWAKDPRCNVSMGTLRARIQKHGYPPEKAITYPLRQKKAR